VKILVISSGNIVQLNKYSIYFSKQGHDVVFINPLYQNSLTNRTIDDEFTKNNIRFFTWKDFDNSDIWKKEKFDCIFGTQQGASMKTLQYQEKLKIPALQQILDIAEGSNLVETSPQEYQRLCITQRPFLEAYKRINYLTGINPAIPEQVKNLIGKDCYCVPYPTDTDLYDSVPEQETEDFVFIVSRLVYMKRVDLAIRACHYANKKLVIASDGGERYTLERLVKGLGADVEFLGYIQDKRKAELMKKCKLHTFSQLWNTGPCIPSAEALYCKKPSIIFDYPAQRAIEGSYSYYIEPGNWEAMGEKIKWVYGNYEEAIKFATEGSKWVKENVSPNVVAQQILNILEEIVKK
jgi:glycosyltransferase involved in cell wall biosynthesis